MGSLDEGGSSGDIINSENVVQWSQHYFADRWNVDDERKRGIKDEENIWGLSNQKGGNAASKMRGCMQRTGVGGGSGNQEFDLGYVEWKC